MFRLPISAKTLPLALLLVGTLTACGEAPPPPTETIRSIRTITVSEPASGKLRRFSGVVEASDSSTISFELPGNVQAVKVEVGDRVTQGQELALLDTRTFELNVEAAEASLRGAEVALKDARTDNERMQRIARQDRGAISQRALDQAQAAYDSAQQTLSYNQSRLSLAQRDLHRTTLLAPFDGVIATRHVDAFREVSRGQPIFDLFMEGAMQAAISIPESEIDRVYLGLPGAVSFPAVAGADVTGIVTEISKVAGNANAFPVKLTLAAETGDARIRPGTTVEVSLLLDDGEGGGYLVPTSALSAGAAKTGDGSGDTVFVFDSDSNTVKRTPITHDGIRGSNLVVTDGLSAGDIVATAGVSFLRDAQPVRLMTQPDLSQ